MVAEIGKAHVAALQSPGHQCPNLRAADTHAPKMTSSDSSASTALLKSELLLSRYSASAATIRGRSNSAAFAWRSSLILVVLAM